MDLVSLMMRPVTLAVRAAGLATLLWIQVMKAMVQVPLDLTCIAAAWTVALIYLPVRIFTALQRERVLEMNLNEMQIQLENLAIETKELEERLRMAIRERNVVETMFEEIEDEHAKALSRIDQLENQCINIYNKSTNILMGLHIVGHFINQSTKEFQHCASIRQNKIQDLKEENMRLNEVRGKVQLDFEADDSMGGGYVHKGFPLAPKNYVVPSWGTDYKETTGVMLEDILMQRDPWGKGDKAEVEEQSLLKVATGSGVVVPSKYVVDETLERRRSLALEQSLFSAILSLLVGIIMWEAEDPCMPLVAALFMVVGMSLSSVVQFFSTIKNKPASNAVALLSFNWFMLGTLTSPLLPSVTRVLAPRASKVVGGIATWLGLSTYLDG